MTLGQRIQEGRLRLGLSQEGLGEKLGVSRQAVSRWEADGAVPDTDKLIALSKLFGITLNELLQVENPPAREPAPAEPPSPPPKGRRRGRTAAILLGALLIAAAAGVLAGGNAALTRREEGGVYAASVCLDRSLLRDFTLSAGFVRGGVESVEPLAEFDYLAAGGSSWRSLTE